VDNIVLRTAGVITLLSNTMLTKKNDEVLAYLQDSSSRILEYRNNLNIDRRTVAIGGSEEIWLQDLLHSMDPSWYNIIRSSGDQLEMLLLSKMPKNVLYTSPGLIPSLFIWLKDYALEGTKLTFLNNVALDTFEQHMYELDDMHSIEEYGAIDYDYLETDIEDKFDFIFGIAWEMVSEPDFVRHCINSLAPGGILHVGLTSNNSKIYRDAYHSHPFYHFHEVLKESDGLTYHDSSIYGSTTFIKSL